MKIPRDIGASELIRALRVLGYESLPQDGSHFPIKNPKSSIENRQSTPLPMGFTFTFPADQSVRRPRQCLLFGTGRLTLTTRNGSILRQNEKFRQLNFKGLQILIW